MLGLKGFATAALSLRGVELMHGIRRGQFDLPALIPQGLNPCEICAPVLTA